MIALSHIGCRRTQKCMMVIFLVCLGGGELICVLISLRQFGLVCVVMPNVYDVLSLYVIVIECVYCDTVSNGSWTAKT